MTYDEVLKLLNGNGILFKIYEHESVMTMKDVETNLPFPIENLLKTLVFKIKNSYWVLAVVKGRDKIDYRSLADALKINLKDLTMPKVDEIESQLGFQIGGICPIPTQDGIKVIFDKKILDIKNVYCGVGRNDRSLEIELKDLLKVSNAEIWPIVKDNK